MRYILSEFVSDLICFKQIQKHDVTYKVVHRRGTAMNIYAEKSSDLICKGNRIAAEIQLPTNINVNSCYSSVIFVVDLKTSPASHMPNC